MTESSELHDIVCMWSHFPIFSSILLMNWPDSINLLQIVGMAALSSQSRGKKGAALSFSSEEVTRQDSDWPICRTWPSRFQFSWFRWWGFILLGHLSKLDYVSRILWWATVGKHCDYRREKSLPKMWDVITKRICDDKTKWQCSPNSTWLYLFDTAGLH